VDLDYVSDASLDKKISSIKEKAAMISGFDVEKPRILHRTLRFDCRYENEFGEMDMVRMEFYLTKTRFLKAEKVLVKSPFVETHPALVRTYSLEDLMARKSIALSDRTEGKDIYDLFYSLDLDFDASRLAKALSGILEFYKMDKTAFVDQLLTRLKDAKKNSSYIGNSTNHFIPRNLRPEWKIFIDTLARKIRKKIADISIP
jgi:predicted nucleotidyltransferase component of viral defense system